MFFLNLPSSVYIVLLCVTRAYSLKIKQYKLITSTGVVCHYVNFYFSVTVQSLKTKVGGHTWKENVKVATVVTYCPY